MDVKTVDEIYRRCSPASAEKTGVALEGGCDLAVRLYAVAAQIYALYVQADWVARQCFPQTALGDYLDKHAQLRGLERERPPAAVGTVRFTAGERGTARAIPAGTVCMTAGLVRFETTQEAALRWGNLGGRARPGGGARGAGNVAAGTIPAMAVAPVGVTA